MGAGENEKGVRSSSYLLLNAGSRRSFQRFLKEPGKSSYSIEVCLHVSGVRRGFQKRQTLGNRPQEHPDQGPVECSTFKRRLDIRRRKLRTARQWRILVESWTICRCLTRKSGQFWSPPSRSASKVARRNLQSSQRLRCSAFYGTYYGPCPFGTYSRNPNLRHRPI